MKCSYHIDFTLFALGGSDLTDMWGCCTITILYWKAGWGCSSWRKTLKSAAKACYLLMEGEQTPESLLKILLVYCTTNSSYCQGRCRHLKHQPASKLLNLCPHLIYFFLQLLNVKMDWENKTVQWLTVYYYAETSIKSSLFTGELI